jgi:protein-S-isoprenylcysteine O-methyltransferase Ste14
MNGLDSARNIVAFIVVASFPPALLMWLLIHPFAAFWRRLGLVGTYAVMVVPVAACINVVLRFRETLLGVDLGTNWVTVVLGVGSAGAGFLVSRQRRKKLDFGTLSGRPELSRERYPGALLTDGIYGLIRHPRYVEAYMWVLGYALFANYLGAYVVVVLCLPVIYAVVVLEERELRERFGPAYEVYCREVPRFLPKRWRWKERKEPGAA